MPIDASIPLQVQPAQPPNILAQYGQAAQIQGIQQRQQLLPGELQAQQLENQQRQIQLKQMADTAAAFKSSLVTNPDGSYDIDSGRLTNALAASGSGQAIPTVLEGVNKYREGIATLKKTQADVAAAHTNNGGALGAAVAAADYDPHLFSTLVQHGIQEGAIDPQGAAPYVKAVTDSLVQDPTGATAKQIVKQIADTWIAGSPKQTELQTGQTTAAARAKEADIAGQKLPGDLAIQQQTLAKTTADATLATAKANLLKDPSSYAKQVDNLNLSTGQAARLKSQVGFYVRNGQIDEANRALDTAMGDANAPGKAAAVAAATAPIDVAKSVAEETAKAPIETARSLQVAATNRANTGADKLDAEYNQARTATESLGKILDLAASGNKAAGSSLPLVGVETMNAINGIKRVNSAEISQYGSAGSLLDNIKGKIQKLTIGQPIPADVLSDIRDLHQALGQQSYDKYKGGLSALEQRTPGVKLPPVLPAPNIRTGLAVGQPVTLKSGKTVTVTAIHPDGTFDAK